MLLVLLAPFLVAGLLNTFGQRPGSTTIRASAASLELSAPSHLRGGLLYSTVVTVRARRTLQHAALVFSPGWATTEQINTIEPSPLGETSRQGQPTLLLGKVGGGSTYRLFMQFQGDRRVRTPRRRRLAVRRYQPAHPHRPDDHVFP